MLSFFLLPLESNVFKKSNFSRNFSEAYDEYLEWYVERATVCGVLITGFILNVISEILLYNNFNSRFSTVKDSLQKQQELQLEEYQKQMERDNVKTVEILFTKFVVPVTQLLMLVQNPVVMWKFYDGRKRRKLKEYVPQRRNIDDFLCDTYYKEENDE